MNIITRREKIANVAQAWKKQYYERNKWIYNTQGDKEAKYNRLMRLPSDATEHDIEEIIGNDSWTGVDCNICEDEHCIAVIGLGRSAEYGEPLAWVCLACLQEAAISLKTVVDNDIL